MEQQASPRFWKISTITLVIILFFVVGYQSKAFLSETISTRPSDPIVDIYSQIKQIHDISPGSLDKGLLINLEEKDAIRLKYGEKYYTAIVFDIKDKSMSLFFQKGNLTISYNKTYAIDLDQEGNPDIEIRLMQLGAQGESSEIYLKTFERESLIPSGDYFELFDVTVRLASERIYGAESLLAFIIFENFGEGPSEIDIQYSIIDENSEKVYSGIDTKIVQTEDRVVKNFNFLNLKEGKYIMRAEIFYGDNQTAEAEQDFEVVSVPVSILIEEPAVFITLIILASIIIFFVRRYNKGKEGKKKV